MPDLTNHNENSPFWKISIGYSRNSPKFFGNESTVPGSVYPDHTLTAYVIQFHFNIIQPSLPRFFRFSAHDVISHHAWASQVHRPSHPQRFAQPINTPWRVQRMKTKITPLPPLSFHFLLFRPKYSPISDACFQLHAFIYVGILHKKL